MTRWRPGVQRTPWNWAASSQTKPAHGNGLLQAPTTPPGTRALPGYNLSCFEVLCWCHKPSQKWTGPRSFSRPQRILTVDCLTLGWKKKKKSSTNWGKFGSLAVNRADLAVLEQPGVRRVAFVHRPRGGGGPCEHPDTQQPPLLPLLLLLLANVSTSLRAVRPQRHTATDTTRTLTLLLTSADSP